MASSSKKKTTMKKLNRENAVRERRMRKQARKDARKQAAADGSAEPGVTHAADDEVLDAPQAPGSIAQPGSPTA
jgi:hypothetical protein